MSTKTTMRLLQFGGILMALLGLLTSVTHRKEFLLLAGLLAFLMFVFLGYAWFRENFRNDKSL